MATVNYASREICCKIVYYGAGFCGKTVSLQHVHKTVAAQYRGELISLATEQDRTLFFDFLALELGAVGGFDTKFQLYTVPGQVFYNATRKLVLRGVDGIVFVVDSQRTRLHDNLESFNNLKENLADYGYELGHIPWVIQYNKRDLPDILSVEELEAAINSDKVPAFESVAITGKGVKETLKGIAGLVLTRIGSRSQTQHEPKTAPERVGTAPSAFGGSRRQAVVAPATEHGQPLSAQAGGAGAEGETDQKSRTRFVAPQRADRLDGRGRARAFYVRQKCDVRWHGICIGSALLEFIDRSSIDGKGAYQLSGTINLFGVFRRYRLEFLAYRGEELFPSVEGESVYFTFAKAHTGDTPDKAPISVWVRNNRDRTFYARHHVAGLEVLMSPEGKRHILRQL